MGSLTFRDRITHLLGFAFELIAYPARFLHRWSTFGRRQDMPLWRDLITPYTKMPLGWQLSTAFSMMRYDEGSRSWFITTNVIEKNPWVDMGYEIREWFKDFVDGPEPIFEYTMLKGGVFVFKNANDAFAFRMRWT